MPGDLARYLRAEAGRRFELGRADCATLVADWVRECRGVDPIGPQRGYSLDEEARAIVAGRGGLVRAVGRAMRREGIRLTSNPRPGDVAVLSTGTVVVCAVRTERGWVMRLADGLARFPLERVRVLAAWAV